MLLQACAAGSLAAVKYMIELEGVDVDGEDEQTGDQPLQVAAFPSVNRCNPHSA
jgi:hypothetical protein